DVDSFTMYMILNVWAQNHDWPHNNWYAARPARPGGRWIFLCWDAEFGLGRVPGGFNADTFSHVFSRGDSAFSVILQALLKNPGYQERFLAELDRHLAGALSPENVVAVIDRQARLVAEDMPEEAALTGRTVDIWRENLESMRAFAHGRGAAIRSFIVRSNRFTFPQVTSATPRVLSPTGEVEIILRGVRFTESTEVRFNGVPSPRVTFVDSRRLDVVVPFDERLAGMPVITAVDPEMGTSSSRDIIRVEVPTAARARSRASLDPAIVPPVGRKRLDAARVPGGVRSELRDARPRSGPTANDAAEIG